MPWCFAFPVHGRAYSIYILCQLMSFFFLLASDSFANCCFIRNAIMLLLAHVLI